MSTEIVRQDSYAHSPLELRMQYAGTLAHAGELIPSGLRSQGQPSQGKILLVMETGAMLGIHPVAALQGVHVIEGKATISPALMGALVRRSGHTLRVKMAGTFDAGDLTATATLIRNDDPDHPFEVTWDLGRARRANLLPGKSGSAWAKYPEAMLKARATSEVCREGATDVLMGVGYVPEELGAEVNESGEVIDYQQVREDAPQPREDRSSRPEPASQGSPAPEATPEPQTEAPRLPNGLYDFNSLTDVETSRQMFRAARTAGHLGHLILVPIPGTDDHEQVPFGEWLIARGTDLANAAEAKAEEPTTEAEAEAEPAADPATGEVIEDAEVVED